jgi:hypothetical protein
MGEADMVVTRLTGTGTQQGELMGIPATGQKVTVTAIAMARIAQGRVQETWNSWDTLGLMQQLGAASPPRPTPEDYAWLPPSPLTGDPGDPEVNKTMITRFVELGPSPTCTAPCTRSWPRDKRWPTGRLRQHGGDLSGNRTPADRSVLGATPCTASPTARLSKLVGLDIMGLMQNATTEKKP